MTEDQDQGTSIADALQRLADIAEIKALKARYCNAVDTKDWAGFGALLVDDYHFDSDGGVFDGRDNVVRFVEQALGNATTVHHVHEPEIEITGSDTAHALWPMYDYVTIPGENGGMTLHGYGWYDEDYVRTADGWRLSRCVEKRQRVDMTGEVPPRVAGLQGPPGAAA